MENLRQEFLVQAISTLENLLAKLQTEPFSEHLAREFFRAFHTVKGNSQTFNLSASAKFAHEIENLLEARRERQIEQFADFEKLLREAVSGQITVLRRAQSGEKAVFPDSLAEKIRHLTPHRAALTDADFSETVSPEILARLSAEEKKSLAAAISGGKLPHLFAVNFNLADFDGQFKTAREILTARGEIVAVFPNAATPVGKIGFRFLFLSGDSPAEIAEIFKDFETDFVFQTAENQIGKGIGGLLAQIVAMGDEAAQKLGKKVIFESSAEIPEPDSKRLKLILDVLLHLVRNAVDHAFEISGKLKIDVRTFENDLILRVEDDGRGIDVKKVRAKAIEKNLIAPNEQLTDRDALQLIFTHGFSTKETLTEISGRGVGLDAVQDAVKSAGGEIHVESAAGRGTIFEIRLPGKN